MTGLRYLRGTVRHSPIVELHPMCEDKMMEGDSNLDSRLRKMGLIPVKQVVEVIRHSTTFEIALGAGLVAGSVYHFTCQYPKQRDALPSIYMFLAGQLWFVSAILVSLGNHTILSVCGNYFLFDLIYVLSPSDLAYLQFGMAVILKTIYNVYFRHSGIPTKFLFAASDWTLFRHAQNKTYELKVQELHKQLGIILFYETNRRGCCQITTEPHQFQQP